MVIICPEIAKRRTFFKHNADGIQRYERLQDEHLSLTPNP